MTAKEALGEVLKKISEDDAELLLALYESNVAAEELTEDDVGRILENREAVRRGDKMSLEELRNSLGR